MKQTLFIVSLFFACGMALAQKDEKFTLNEVKQQCANMPLDQRARLSVTRFTVTTTTHDAATEQNANQNNRLKAIGSLFGNGNNAPAATTIPPILGENLTTMLTNALQEVNCYRVLESLSNSQDLNGEIDASKNGYSSKKTPKAGKQLGAQIVVMGEVIEYSEKQKGSAIMGVGSKKKYIKMGFNLKMVNPETRDVIASHVFRIESRAEKSVSVLGLVNTDNSDPATAAVMEDGVIMAVQYMAKVRDSLNLTANGNFAGNSSANGDNDTEITLSNATYPSYSAFASILASVPGYKSMEKSFSGGVGTFTVTHSGKKDALLDEISKKIGNKYEVTGEGASSIELKVK